ncbi:MAG: Crp/Fnr family transcriptional regulator, partial [Fidelibacterota bacterium]
MTRRSYGRNDMILMEHEFGDTFFVISSGSVKITHLSEDGREVIFAILGKGEFFGEMALFEEEPRSANAVALEETDVFILRRGEFLAFIEEYPQIVISLITEMARRIRRSDLQIEG